MSQATAVSAVLLVECAIMTGAWLYVTWPHIKTRYRVIQARRKDSEWALVNDYLDMVHGLFGSSVEFTRTTLRGGAKEISLTCRKCGKKNRLKERFRGASCGSCRTSLVVRFGEKASNEAERKNEMNAFN